MRSIVANITDIILTGGDGTLNSFINKADCDNLKQKLYFYASGSGNDLEIGFNNRYLMDALRYAPADEVKIELNSGITPAIIVPTEGEENFLYMVLPVRLKATEV